MTGECPVPHEERERKDPIFFNTQASRRRLLAGERPNNIFVHSKGRVSEDALRDSTKSPTDGKKERLNTVFAAGSHDIITRLMDLPLTMADSIEMLDPARFPLHAATPVDIDFLDGVYLPVTHHVEDEMHMMIFQWKTKKSPQDTFEDVARELVEQRSFGKNKTREAVGSRFATNSLILELIPPYYESLLYVYQQQIGKVDPQMAQKQPNPSLTTFQDMARESVGLVLNQAARSSLYLQITDGSQPFFDIAYSPDHDDDKLQLRRRPNGTFRVSLAPEARKAIEEQYDREQPSTDLITGCPAMPLTQAVLGRIDSYIEAFKAA